MAIEFVRINPASRVKIQIVQGTVVNQRHAEVGDVVEVGGSDALFLIGNGRARRHIEQEPSPAEAGTPAAAAPVPTVKAVPAKPAEKSKTEK